MESLHILLQKLVSSLNISKKQSRVSDNLLELLRANGQARRISKLNDTIRDVRLLCQSRPSFELVEPSDYFTADSALR